MTSSTERAKPEHRRPEETSTAGPMSFVARTDYSRALGLSGLALGNFVLFYVTNILLARTLSIRDFDDYSVAVSIVTVLGTVATLGLEKYALRCLPVYRERTDWAYSAGFERFSVRLVAVFSIALAALLALSVETILVARHADTHIAVVVMVSFLPIISAVLLQVEIATAHGAQIQAIVIYRFLMPAGFFVLVNLLYLFDLSSTAVRVALAYGAAWTLSLLAIRQLVEASGPPEASNTTPRYLPRKWLHRAAPLLVNSCMLSLMASSGVIILELLFTSDSVVGTYAVVAQTGTFIVLLANTTNRFYLPLMSLFMERGDRPSMLRLMRHRLTVIGGLAAAFLTTVLAFGDRILALFGPGFTDGYEALCVLAVGASINAVFSDAPYYLQFMKRSRSVFMSTALGTTVNLVLTYWWSERLGLVGTAYAYTASMGLLFTLQRLQVSHHFRTHWRKAAGE